MGLNKQVTFSTAKLLKEKGFDEPCKLCVEDGDERPLPFNCGNTIHRNSLHPYYSAPTITEVVMWLYEKHGIWIQVTPIPYSDNITHWRWEYMSTIYATRNSSWKKVKDYMSPTEAYEAAIEYTLKNLIP